MQRFCTDQVAELIGALQVISSHRIANERWLEACADTVRVLVRGASAAVVVHGARGVHVAGSAAARVLDGRDADDVLTGAAPRPGVWMGGDRVLDPLASAPSGPTAVAVTTMPTAGRSISIVVLFAAPLDHRRSEECRLLLEIAQPVLSSAAAARIERAPRISGPSHVLEEDSTLSLRERYHLTRRELEVTRLLVRGQSNREVAGALNISEHTARHHTERILEKLGVRSRAAVARALTRLGQLSGRA